MQILKINRLNVLRLAVVGIVAAAVNVVQPTGDAHSDSILSGNLFDFSGSSRLSTQTVLPNKPSIGFDHNSKALNAYKSGEFAIARKLWEEAATNGDVFSQWMLGHMFRYGQGVASDDGIAWKYYRAAAAKFNGDRTQKPRFFITVDATYWLAHYYRRGIVEAGVGVNAKRAFRLFNRAAINGHAAAQYEVGRYFLEGTVIKRNAKQGKHWVMASASKRHAPAMAMMGAIYWTGEDAQQSRTRGLMWYTLAKENACPAINPEIFNRYEELYTVATADERSKAENSAYKWNQQNPLKAGQAIYHVADCN